MIMTSLVIFVILTFVAMVPGVFSFTCDEQGCCGLTYRPNSDCSSRVVSASYVNTCYGNVLCYQGEDHYDCKVRMITDSGQRAPSRFRTAQLCMEQILCAGLPICTQNSTTEMENCVNNIRQNCKQSICLLSPNHSVC